MSKKIKDVVLKKMKPKIKKTDDKLIPNRPLTEKEIAMITGLEISAIQTVLDLSQREAQLSGLTVTELKKIKDAILQLKQGEALERASYPAYILEALGLGYFGAPAAIALSVINAYEEALNWIADTPNDHVMAKFSQEIATASGSREAIRLIETLKTIGLLGGSVVMPSQEFPQPQKLEAPEKG